MSVGVFSRTRQFDADTIKYVNQFSVKPSWKRYILYDDLVKRLKVDLNWGLLDRFWIFAHEAGLQQASLINLVNPLGTQLTEVSAPVWTADQGYTGDGVADYLDTNFIPSTNGVNWVLNSCSAGGYFRINQQADSNEFGGTVITVGTAVRIRNTLNSFLGRINDGTFISAIDSTTDGRGLSSTTRINSTTHTNYKNGIIGSSAASTSFNTNVKLYILVNNNNGTPAAFSTNQVSCFYCGSGNIDQFKIYVAIQRYMTALGTQV